MYELRITDEAGPVMLVRGVSEADVLEKANDIINGTRDEYHTYDKDAPAGPTGTYATLAEAINACPVGHGVRLETVSA